MTEEMIKDDRSMNIDDFLKKVGAFGLFQWILVAIGCLMYNPYVFESFITYFTLHNPRWKCSDNSTMCKLNGTQANDNSFRRTMDGNIIHDNDGETSVIVDYDLTCNSSWFVYMTSSIFYLGKLFGTFILGWVADSFRRKIYIHRMFFCLDCLDSTSQFH